MKRLLPIALLLSLSATLSAQRIGSAHLSARSFPGSHSVHAGYHARYYPIGLFDPLYNDYLQNTGYPVAAQPPVIMLQPPPAASAPEPPAAPSQPLMIELQGERYVQISGNEVSGSELLDQLPRTADPHTQVSAHQQAREAVLIFRDGHRQQITAYTIAGGVLYASSDYATTGSWTQKVDLQSVNIPATVAENNSRQVHFQLPTSPNEVMVGP